MFNKVLVCTDGSETAIGAAEYAVELKKTFPAVDVVVVSVASTTLEACDICVGAFEIPVDHSDRMNAELKHYSRLKLERAVSVFEAAGQKVTSVLLQGDPGTEIAKYAEQESIDHIIIGSRGMGALGRMFLGSVAQKILSLVKCTVTVIKAR